MPVVVVAAQVLVAQAVLAIPLVVPGAQTLVRLAAMQ
jgi:hypothetical protein